MKKDNKFFYGESGLAPDFFKEHSVESTQNECVDEGLKSISEALSEYGLNDSFKDTPLFKEYYDMVSEGPGKDWNEYRRTKFTIQSMNRAGCIELSPIYKNGNNSNETEHALSTDDNEGQITADNVTSKGPVINKGSLKLFDDYNPLTKDELKDNLMVAGGIAGVVLLAVISVVIAVMTDSPAIGATGGGISIAVFVAVASRLAGHYHHRFTLKYRLPRLLVCLALIFTNAARNAVKVFWEQLCHISQTEIPVIPFGITMTVTLLLMALWAYIALCRTMFPPQAKALGWIEALCLTFATGSFMFSAIS